MYVFDRSEPKIFKRFLLTTPGKIKGGDVIKSITSILGTSGSKFEKL